MYLQLRLNITRLNIIAYFVLQFATYLLMNFMQSFLSYILKSPDYYDVSKKDVGNVLGTLGFYSELAVILADFIIGALMDLMGRKWPIIIGLFISALSVMAIPYGHHSVYSYLCIFKYHTFKIISF